MTEHVAYEALAVEIALTAFLEWEAESTTSDSLAELPPECHRRCIATLAAWELLLSAAQPTSRWRYS